MTFLQTIPQKFNNLKPQVRNVILGHFFLEFMNAGVFVLLNIYMAEKGYSDSQIATYTSLRYLTVVLLAYVLGRYAYAFPMRKVFLALGSLFPMISLMLIYNINTFQYTWIQASMIIWGFFALLMQVFTIPYLLLHTKKENLAEALSYNFATQSIAAIFIGIMTYCISKFSNQMYNSSHAMQLFAVFGFFSLLFFSKLPSDSLAPKKTVPAFASYDWKRIFKVLFPTFLIALGAGMTIQFMNLFFYNVFHFSTEQYALLSFFSSIFVSIFSLSVPTIREKLGYVFSITVSQCIAISLLILLGTTEFFSEIPSVIYIAIFLFLFRNPFMNMAAPSTTELAMVYVGEKNREMVASMQAAIWSGLFFVSGQLFSVFREHHIRYAYIFYITAFLYIIGVYLYHQLIIACKKESLI